MARCFTTLIERRRARQIDTVAIVRLEQIYPFPYSEIKRILARYSKARQVVWCQEEPRNQGAWRSNKHRIERILGKKQTLEYAGRDPSASTAVGYASLHEKEQAELIDRALGIASDKQCD